MCSKNSTAANSFEQAIGIASITADFERWCALSFMSVILYLTQGYCQVLKMACFCLFSLGFRSGGWLLSLLSMISVLTPSLTFILWTCQDSSMCKLSESKDLQK